MCGRTGRESSIISYFQLVRQLILKSTERLRQAIEIKRPELNNRKGVVFRNDNARPHISLMTLRKLRELGWEILLYPPYSPDKEPSDYYLFRLLQNSLNEIKVVHTSKNYFKKYLFFIMFLNKLDVFNNNKLT